MIKLENTVVSGWEAAIRGCRNPMNSWDKSDSLFYDYDGDYHTIYGDYGPCGPIDELDFEIGPNDMKMMKGLIISRHSSFSLMNSKQV